MRLAKRSLLLTSLIALGLTACSDPEPKDVDMANDMAGDMSADTATADLGDMTTTPDMCMPPDDLSQFCKDKCGMQVVSCTGGEQSFDCGFCEVAAVEIKAPQAEPSGLVVNLGEDAIPLEAVALDAQGAAVPCEIQWTITNDDPQQQAVLAKQVVVDGESRLLPVSQGKVSLEAACGEVKATLPVQILLPGFTKAPTAHKLWLRPEFGMEVSDGKLTAWRNTIAAHPDFIADGAGNEPSVVEAGLAGYNVASFGGTQRLVATPESQLKYVYLRQQASIFMVLKTDQAREAQSQLLIGGCNADGGYQLRTKANESNVLVYYHMQKDSAEFFSQEFNPTRLADGFVLLSVQADDAGLRVRINGQPAHYYEGQVLGQGRSFNIANIGGWCDGMIGLKGQVAEVLGFEAGFGQDDEVEYRDRIERYLLNKYALQ